MEDKAQEVIEVKVTMRQRLCIIGGQLVDVVLPNDPPRLEFEEQRRERKEAGGTNDE